MSTPQVTQQPLNALVQKIRAAHPGAYDDMDDATLTKAVLAKYPQYSDLATDPYAAIAKPIATDPYAAIATDLPSTHGQETTVPFFAPDGKLRDVPHSQMKAAIAAGGKRAVSMKGPDGKPGWIPEDRVQDAVKAGATIDQTFTDVQPIQAAQPVTLDMSTAQPLDQPSAASRLGTNFLSGLGITSDEDAKNFFVHPLDRVIKSFQAQGELAKKAKESYDKGDYKGALQHALNYLVPFVGQQTDQAGEQLKQGDIAGGVGRTLGAAVPIIAGSPEVQGAASDVAGQVGRVAGKAANVARDVTPKQAAQVVGGTSGAVAGHGPLSIPGAYAGAKGAGSLAEGILGKERANSPLFAKAPINPGGPFPEAPPPEVFQAQGLATGGQAPPRPQAAALGDLPAPAVHQALQELGPAASVADVTARANQIAGAGIPRTLSGESALTQILTGQDNANLLKLARSRGINVTQEAQLKPGVADQLLIKKIQADMTPEELDEIGAKYLENQRMGGHQFGAIGSEPWKAMSLQTYFPDVKIPAAVLKRTQNAIAGTANGGT